MRAAGVRKRCDVCGRRFNHTHPTTQEPPTRYRPHKLCANLCGYLNGTGLCEEEILVDDIKTRYLREHDGEKFAAAAALGIDLMRGDAEQLKAGYTFANACAAACELFGFDTPTRVAIVAETMHEACSLGAMLDTAL